MDKKAQFTIFVLLGVVIMIVVGLFLFSINSLLTSDLDERAREAVQDFLNTGPINYLVNSCLENAAYEAVEFYARQEYLGDNPQEGITHIPYNVSNEIINISYSLITQTENYCNAVDTQVPMYPKNATRFNQLIPSYSNDNNCVGLTYGSSGFFGYNNHQRLCSIPGDNLAQISDLEDVSISTLCRLNLENRFSLINADIGQDNLERKFQKIINESMSECVDFEIFSQYQGHNVTMLNDPEFKIIFDLETFSVKANYPFQVKLRNRQPIITSHNFEFDSNIRLTRIQSFIYNLISNEALDINFNATRDFNNILYHDEFIQVQRIDFEDAQYDEYRYDWILNITDQASSIRGEVLSILIPFKNRRPALDYIRETTLTNPYHIMVVEGDVIHLKPSALDPDAKQITYEYSGWKETYDERYRLGDDDCAFDTVENIQNCVERIEDVVPNNWTESSQYQSTFKEAAITTNESDIGPHKVNITARDISGLIDYQTINLLVFDLPTVNISINPLYPNVPENILSVEDPFTFDGTDSAPPVIGGEENTIVKYEFLAQKESSDFDVEVFNEETNEDKSYLDVPEDVSGSFTIENIKNKVLNDPVIHRLTLTIYALVPSLDPSITLDASDSVDVTVKECVPYRADSLPFPYNTNSNPFLANHSCCGGEIQQPDSYQLLDSDNICYFKDGYSYLEAAFEEIQELNKSVESIDHDFTLEFSEGNINDIYKLEFERACDGTRGNICAGDVNANLQVYEACNFEEDFTEQCSGPLHSFFSNSALSCINYQVGSTFESQIQGSGSGRCYEETACSTRGGEYGDGGVMSCTAGCDGEGGCTAPLDCSCDMTCGAECDGTQSVFEEIDGEFICNHECETGFSCQFQTQTILPCQPGNSCLRENFNSNNDKYCYFDVSCSDDTSNFQRGQTCQDPGTQIQQGDETLCVTENFNNTQYSECTDNGECNRVTENLNDYLQEFGECDEEQALNCTNSGWTCVDE